MASSSPNAAPLRRARRSLWILVGIAVLAAGSLSATITAGSAPLTGLRVAVSGLVLVGSVVLAARVMFALERARRATADNQGGSRAG
jgi:hypothetical protein